jgi:hypothetical protein
MRCRPLTVLSIPMVLVFIACADKDPVSSYDLAPAARTLSGAPVAASCDVPGCRPGFGNITRAAPPSDQTIPHLDVLPTIDGNLSDWTRMFSQAQLQQRDFVSTVGDITGDVPKDDQRVEAWLGWNEETNMIYVAGRVFDNARGFNSAPDDAFTIFRNDDMEVYIDGDNSGGLYSVDDGHAQEYVMSTSFPRAVLLIAETDGSGGVGVSSAARSRDVAGGVEYTYEISFPAWNNYSFETGPGERQVLQAGDVIGFGVVFADYDSQDAADASAYHAFNALNGMVNGFFDADAMPDFELGAPKE